MKEEIINLAHKDKSSLHSKKVFGNPNLTWPYFNVHSAFYYLNKIVYRCNAGKRYLKNFKNDPLSESKGFYPSFIISRYLTN